MAFSNDREGLRRYLLDPVSDEGREETEQRILTDDAFFEELEIAEDELVDEYLAGELTSAERQLFEEHFLAASERQAKLKFARVLHSIPVANARPEVDPGHRNWIEKMLAAWNQQTWLVRASAFAVVILIVAGGLWFARPRLDSPKTYAAVTLAVSNVDRSQGAVAAKLSLPIQADVLRLRLELPETAARYRVELVKENGEKQTLTPVAQDGQSVFVELPANQLTRGQYAFQIYAIKGDGAEQRMKGSYLLNLE